MSTVFDGRIDKGDDSDGHARPAPGAGDPGAVDAAGAGPAYCNDAGWATARSCDSSAPHAPWLRASSWHQTTTRAAG